MTRLREGWRTESDRGRLTEIISSEVRPRRIMPRDGQCEPASVELIVSFDCHDESTALELLEALQTFIKGERGP